MGVPVPHLAHLLPQPHGLDLCCYLGLRGEHLKVGPEIWSQRSELGGWFEEAGPSGGDGVLGGALSGPAVGGGHLRHLLESYPGARSEAENAGCPALSSARRGGRHQS